ncbi:sensor histidine kinase [Chitinophaga flava]|uniref:Histidine kinase n=1 Tax=Chitinophaga flava TaxID=2259036 RepID=A0A365XS70_9BACT|nr:histidine kinase [Chitinophaga flava]RBL88871.1 histidine kinase [Chitinophaga flava]
MANEWYNRKWAIVATHALVWALLFSLPFLLKPTYEKPVSSSEQAEREAWFYFLMGFYLIQVVFFYINAFLLIPALVQKKRIVEYVGVLMLMLTFYFVSRYTFERFYLQRTTVDPKPTILFSFFTFLFILSASTAYQMIRERIMLERKVSARENENLKTELSLLRSQVSPHFMFNVLNNMVSLARKKSDLLEPSLIKLSSLMRYMLYEADEEKMPLQREVEYLQSYIDLQRQRFGQNVEINVEMNVPHNHYEIEPMLLIPFVENAFKHGTGFIMHAQIDINLFTTADKLFFAVRNKYNHLSEEVKDKTSGIGLANVKRRLNLLYGNDYVLQINSKDDWFYVTLQLNLH